MILLLKPIVQKQPVYGRTLLVVGLPKMQYIFPAARREHDKLLDDAQKELKDLAVTAAKKLVFQSGGDAFDQFLNQAEREEPHA